MPIPSMMYRFLRPMVAPFRKRRDIARTNYAQELLHTIINTYN